MIDWTCSLDTGDKKYALLEGKPLRNYPFGNWEEDGRKMSGWILGE
jgi:hypothetical protein